MKYKIVYLALLSWIAVGCGDFLKEQSQDEIQPSTVKDMEKLLEGEAYPSTSDGVLLNTATDIFTDDIKCNIRITTIEALKSQRLLQKTYFTWDRNMFGSVATNNSDLRFWTICYQRIKGCNVILDYMDGKTGDPVRREHVRGEAYVLRGFYYMMLTNFFGMPYNYGDPAKNLAVPLKLISGVTVDFDKLKKASVAECYKQIEKDLIEGTRLMSENRAKQSIKSTRMNYLAGYALLSRMYLYMGDYENAHKYADLMLKDKSMLLDLKTSKDVGVYDLKTPTEILWTIPMDMPQMGNAPHIIQHTYSLSDDFMTLFGEDVDNGIVDIRGACNELSRFITIKSAFVKLGQETVYNAAGTEVVEEITWAAKVEKGYYNGSISYCGGIRVAEMYLNRAEVSCRRYLATGNVQDAQSALDDLNMLRENRFKAGYVHKTMANFNDAQALLDFCLRERRRELCGESNHRWFDLRRLGMPEIKHDFYNTDGYKTEYVLPMQSSNYALPIPDEVIKRNPNLND